MEANAGISIGASELSITEKFIFVCFDTASRAAVSTRENFAKLSNLKKIFDCETFPTAVP